MSIYETLESTSRDTLPPTRPHLLTVLLSMDLWGPFSFKPPQMGKEGVVVITAQLTLKAKRKGIHLNPKRFPVWRRCSREWQHPLWKTKPAGLKNMGLERRANSVLCHTEDVSHLVHRILIVLNDETTDLYRD